VDNVKSREDNSRLLGDTSPGLALNATLIVATTDAEETVLSPVSIPGVGAGPELLTVLLTVADKLDSVTTLKTTSGVVIDTRAVAHEILINLKGNLEGTVGGELSLHVLLTDEGVRLGTLALVSGPIKSSVASALLLALRSDHAGVVASSVRIALIRDNTSADPVLPGATGLTTVARTTASESGARAAVDILSRKSNILTLEDVHTIRHGFGGTESPAGATVLLVADLSHGSAVGPLGASIEGLGSSGNLSKRVFLNPPGVSMDVVEVNTKKAASLALGHTSDGVVRSLPGLLLVVDLTDHAGADGDLLSEGSDSNKSKNESNLVHSYNTNKKYMCNHNKKKGRKKKGFSLRLKLLI